MSVRFYTSAGPSWWPFQVVSLGNGRLPPRGEPSSYYFLVDNGMFRFYREGRRPDPDAWLDRLAVFVRRVERLRRPAGLMVVLPDWLGDPRFTLGVAGSRRARGLCRDYSCVGVAHAWGSLGGYRSVARELASLEWISVVAAPLKLPCGRFSRRAGRLYVRPECQARIVREVYEGAREYGVPVHGLGLLLRPSHVAAVSGFISSFDSSSWTRPINGLGRSAGWSAKNKREKEEYFAMALMKLLSAGVPLEVPELISHGGFLEAVGVVANG